jgi:hypothetical protein
MALPGPSNEMADKLALAFAIVLGFSLILVLAACYLFAGYVIAGWFGVGAAVVIATLFAATVWNVATYL